MTAAEDQHTVSPFATMIVLPIAGLVAVLHCVAATSAEGYWFDEVYMLAIGRHHLDWGSADQPPITPALAALMDAIAPGSVLALRVPVMLATAAAVVVAALIARELGGDRRAQGVTAFAQATGVWVALGGHWLTPYMLEPVQWLLMVWLLVRWIRVRDDRLLLVFGVVAGVAALTKFQVLLLCAVLIAAVAAVGPRELLRRRLLWAGAAVAALLAAPTLLWQHANGWPQLSMGSVVIGEADALYGGRFGVAVQMLLFAGIIGTALMGYGLWRLWREPELREYRFIGVAFVVLFVVFVAAPGRPYYVAGLYAPLAAFGALGLQHRRQTGRRGRGWLVWMAGVSSAALAAAVLVLSVTIIRADAGEQIAGDTAAAYHALPEEQRQHTVVIGQSYIVAAYLDGYSTRFGLPQAYSTNRSYGFFPPPPAEYDTVLYVGSDDDEISSYFAQSRPIADVGDDMQAYLLTGQRRSWEQIWPRMRTLTVG
ncbi:glycosyl transferase family 39 [Mycolicibacterium pulveris]|uniref:Glycosyl transferase family 39 n=1 Tax=Mycolicibacterium pulveris TaxID=36813 RepID=A0A7I7UQ03_MYCPV|nr:glycosyl transferase family 39 [Mycolicibacterium pulveris]